MYLQYKPCCTQHRACGPDGGQVRPCLIWPITPLTKQLMRPLCVSSAISVMTSPVYQYPRHFRLATGNKTHTLFSYTAVWWLLLVNNVFWSRSFQLYSQYLCPQDAFTRSAPLKVQRSLLAMHIRTRGASDFLRCCFSKFKHRRIGRLLYMYVYDLNKRWDVSTSALDHIFDLIFNYHCRYMYYSINFLCRIAMAE